MPRERGDAGTLSLCWQERKRLQSLRKIVRSSSKARHGHHVTQQFHPRKRKTHFNTETYSERSQQRHSQAPPSANNADVHQRTEGQTRGMIYRSIIGQRRGTRCWHALRHGGPWKRYAACDEPGTRGHTPCESAHTAWPEQANPETGRRLRWPGAQGGA